MLMMTKIKFALNLKDLERFRANLILVIAMDVLAPVLSCSVLSHRSIDR